MKKTQPAYVTHEQAKWLKEKGFDEECTHSYCQSVRLNRPIGNCFQRINQYKPNVKEEWLAPEQHQVVKWLFENHGIWISVDNLIDNRFYFSIRNTKTLSYASRKGCEKDGYNSEEEAYSAAFDYIKDNNLI